jgi:hypothetical protein
MLFALLLGLGLGIPLPYTRKRLWGLLILTGVLASLYWVMIFVLGFEFYLVPWLYGYTNPVYPRFYVFYFLEDPLFALPVSETGPNPWIPLWALIMWGFILSGYFLVQIIRFLLQPEPPLETAP